MQYFPQNIFHENKNIFVDFFTCPLGASPFRRLGASFEKSIGMLCIKSIIYNYYIL